MYNEETVTALVAELQEVAAEVTPTLRKKKLEDLLNVKHVSVKDDLLNLVLSFQINEIYAGKKPTFNTLPFTGFTESIEMWLGNQELNGISYIMQSIIYYMSSYRSINLSLPNVAASLHDYTEPYDWISENVVIPTVDKRVMCNVCHGPKGIAEQVCEPCKSQLKTFMEYRAGDFILDVTHATCRWLLDINVKPFETIIGRYIVSSDESQQIKFKYIQDSSHPVQGLLPFPEYQRAIS